MSAIYAGAVYNHYLAEQMNFPIEGLRKVVEDWEGKSSVKKFFSYFNPFANSELKVRYARDLIAASEDPNGKVAEKD